MAYLHRPQRRVLRTARWRHGGLLDQRLRLGAEAAEQAEEAYNNSPEVQLYNAYVDYMLIRDFYESRKGHLVQYLTSDQYSNAKSKVKEIEDTIVEKNKIDPDAIWNKAEKYYVAKWGSTIDRVKATGEYNEEYLARTVKNHLIYLSNIHKKVTGGTKIEKDF